MTASSVSTVRPYRADDESALIALWNATMWVDPIDALAWRIRYLLDPHFDPANCLVAERDGGLAGFVLGFDRSVASDPSTGDAWIVGFGVAPDARRQRFGRALFAALFDRWSATGTRRVLVGPWVPGYVAPGVDVAAYAEALPFLAALGARKASRPLSMKASLTGYRVHEDVPALERMLGDEGVVVRTVAAADIMPLLAFLTAHFPHWRGDATEVLRAIFAGDGSAVTMHVALDKGEIAGYAQSRGERFGPFGVDERQRGRGIGAVLLARTLVAMRARGFHAAWFLWTTDRAAKLYRTHGFEEVRRFSLVTIDLPIPAGETS